MSDTIERVRAHFAQDLGAEKAATIATGDSLITSGILDSTRLLKLITFVEEAFGVAIPMEDLEPDNFSSLDAIAAFVATKQSQGS